MFQRVSLIVRKRAERLAAAWIVRSGTMPSIDCPFRTHSASASRTAFVLFPNTAIWAAERSELPAIPSRAAAAFRNAASPPSPRSLADSPSMLSAFSAFLLPFWAEAKTCVKRENAERMVSSDVLHLRAAASSRCNPSAVVFSAVACCWSWS